jgi:hypothetical protein
VGVCGGCRRAWRVLLSAGDVANESASALAAMSDGRMATKGAATARGVVGSAGGRMGALEDWSWKDGPHRDAEQKSMLSRDNPSLEIEKREAPPRLIGLTGLKGNTRESRFCEEFFHREPSAEGGGAVVRCEFRLF